MKRIWGLLVALLLAGCTNPQVVARCVEKCESVGAPGDLSQIDDRGNCVCKFNMDKVVNEFISKGTK